jgi:membrane-associated phospholipid phosphatase
MNNPVTVLIHQLRSGDVVLAVALVLISSWAVYRLLRASGIASRSRLGERCANVASQMAAVLALEQAYEFARAQIPLRTDIAFINAYRLLDFEWRHGLFVEERIERFFLQFHTLMNAIELFYIGGHLVLTISVIVWVYVRRPEHYPFMRNLFALATAIALVAFYLYPTAPPRMLQNYGFLDPLQLHNLVGPGGAQPDSYTYNPYAAMPSLHVAYALIVGWTLLISERNRVARCLAALYPFAMAATVVITANHYLLDVAGGFVTVAVAGTVLLTANLARGVLQPRMLRLVLAARGWRTPPVEKVT